MKYVCALIVVKDIKRSRSFYENILGQKVEYDFGENVAFEGGFAIHLEDHYARLLNIENDNILTKSNNFELYFESDDIESVFIALKKENTAFIHQIKDQPWGQRVMRFYDPDFHVIEIGETMEAVVLRFYGAGLSIEEICKKSSMPEEFVRNTIRATETGGGTNKHTNQECENR